MVKEISEEVAEQGIKDLFISCNLIHDHSCEYGFIQKFYLVMKTALKFYLPIHIIPILIFKIKKLKSQPFEVFKHFIKNMIRSCLFMSSWISLFRYFLCFTKNTRGVMDRWNPIIAGFIGTMGILWEPVGRRTELTLYILPKSLEAFWKFLKKRNLVKDVPKGEVLLFAIAWAIIMYCYQNEESSIKSSYLTIIRKFYGVN